MAADDLRWERQSSLKQMMDRYNRLVEEMEALSTDVERAASAISVQYTEMADKFHELNDKILTVNYKTDEMKMEINSKLDDILKRINKNHPGA